MTWNAKLRNSFLAARLEKGGDGGKSFHPLNFIRVFCRPETETQERNVSDDIWGSNISLENDIQILNNETESVFPPTDGAVGGAKKKKKSFLSSRAIFSGKRKVKTQPEEFEMQEKRDKKTNELPDPLIPISTAKPHATVHKSCVTTVYHNPLATGKKGGLRIFFYERVCC